MRDEIEYTNVVRNIKMRKAKKILIINKNKRKLEIKYKTLTHSPSNSYDKQSMEDSRGPNN
jgi:hypothetical protein